jgi:hypothetical protein
MAHCVGRSSRRRVWSAAPILFLAAWSAPFSDTAFANEHTATAERMVDSLTTGQSPLPHENIPINKQIQVAQNAAPGATWTCPPNAPGYYYQPGGDQGCYPPQSYYQGYPPQGGYQGYGGYSGGYGGYSGGYGGYSGGGGGYSGGAGFGGSMGGGSGQSSIATGSGYAAPRDGHAYRPH